MFKTIITAIALTVAATSSASALKLSCITHDLEVSVNIVNTWIKLTDNNADETYTFENKGINEHNNNLFINMDDDLEGLIIFMDYANEGFKNGSITFDGGETSHTMQCNINN